MANVYAVKSGNWSDTTVWNTGALPTSVDDVYSNNFTIAADTTTTVLSIRNTAATGITAGGGFTAVNGVTLTCAGTGIVTGVFNVACFTSFLTSNQSATIIGEIARSGTTGRGVNNNSSGQLNFIGNSIGGGNNQWGVFNSSSGTLNITGNCTGGTDVTGYGAYNASSGTVNITGNVIGGGGSNLSFANHGAYNNSNGTLNITGNCISSFSPAVVNNSSGTMTIVGTISIGTASSTYSVAPGSTSQNTFLTGPFIGTAQGVVANNALRWRWVASVGSSYMTVPNSTATGYKNLFTADNSSSASGQPAATNVRSGTVYGPSNELTGTCAVPGASSVLSGVPVDNTTGTATISAASIRAAMGLASANLDTQLSTISTNVSALPSASTIASTIWQTLTSALTTAGSVGKLLVDNINATISSRLASASYTAPLDAAGTRTAIGLATANLDSQLSPLPNLDTTVSSRLATAGYTTPPSATQNASAVRTELSPELGRIDTTVSSRLASASYQTPLDASGTRAAIGLASANLDSQLDALPTAGENALAVRTELAPELNNLDAAVSTRSTFNPATDTVANVTLVGTTTNLTNPPDVPTTGEIADAVRIELTPELDRIDADVSSRLASVDYTTPPTALENAQAVEIQLSLPLGNMDVAVSTRSTFNPTTDTVAQVTLVDTTTDLTNPPVVPTPEQIAEAVRTELAPELDRVSNCATVSTTGQQIQNALSS